jgi:outer membrane protein OmpA-like peptidoglycan-associated protein
MLVMSGGCATAPPKPVGPTPQEQATMLKVEVEQRTQDLLRATDALRSAQDDLDDQKRRLRVLCIDYPDHQSCDLHSKAAFARKAFCEDEEFTQHIDDVVASCQQGQCKQVDEANLLERTNYMRLVQRLPHKLILFKVNKFKLDRKDKRELQTFLENVAASEGYLIVVGRASRDGSWQHNLRLALDRAESTRKYLVDDLGIEQDRAGYITYGHPKMYITEMDAERLAGKKLTSKQANRSALVFAYPCFEPGRDVKDADYYF